jgi:hypothetical protein
MKLAIALVGVCVSSMAAAAPRARSVRGAIAAARTECKQPGARLSSMVAQVFDASAFAPRVIDHWKDLTDDQRAAFVAEADRVVGGEERAGGVAAICVPHMRIEQAWEQGDHLWFVAVRHPGDDGDCAKLMFRDDGGTWRFDGVWFCGKSIFLEQWRRKLGGGDYDKAMAYLRAQ